MYGPPAAFYGFTHGILIDGEFCTGCLECFEASKARACGVISYHVVEGRKKAFVQHPERCVGCFRCLERCRTRAISCTVTSKWFAEGA
ncbi:MAG: hypothetical protein LBD25_07520 [Coriobacteriales bacterium]|nr:hypothetical protein [Coriobacteriales bacterium]